MRSKLKIALTSLAGWLILTAPAVAELCPSALPEYELVYSDTPTGGVSAIDLFSQREIEQGE
ncbi:MAG: hypothetical protein AAF703_14100, partial [Cyanobacteria bacterium P01_D01_bin.105]